MGSMSDEKAEPPDQRRELAPTAEPVFDYPIPPIDVDALPPDDPLVQLRQAIERIRAIKF